MIPASFPFPFNHRAWLMLHPHPHPRQRRHSSFSLPILASLLITLNPSTEHRRTATCLSAVAPRVYCCRFSRGPVCCLPAPACLFRSLSIPSFCKRREGSGLASRCISATMHVGDHVTSKNLSLAVLVAANKVYPSCPKSRGSLPHLSVCLSPGLSPPILDY
jgi:hypothetical protein